MFNFVSQQLSKIRESKVSQVVKGAKNKKEKSKKGNYKVDLK